MLKFRLITPNTSQISFIDQDSFLFLLQNSSEKMRHKNWGNRQQHEIAKFKKTHTKKTKCKFLKRKDIILANLAKK